MRISGLPPHLERAMKQISLSPPYRCKEVAMRRCFLLIAVSLLAGCSATRTPAGGALAGGVAGAGIGAGIGSMSGHAGEGAAIGAPIGAVTGAVVAANYEENSIAENQRTIEANQQAIRAQEARLRAAQRALQDETRGVTLPESSRRPRYEGPTVMPYYR